MRFHAAVQRLDISSLTALLEAGVDINCLNSHGDTALLTGLRWKSNIVAFLIEKGANPNIVSREGRTCLGLAMQGQQWTAVKLLLQKGANPNLVDQNRFSPLFFAVYTRNLEIVTAVVEAGANIEWVGPGQQTPLMLALKIGETIDIIKYLIEKGANVNVTNDEGHSSLMLAVMKNDMDYFEAIAQIPGIDPNVKTVIDGNTALHYAGWVPECIPHLLELGANPNLQNEHGDTALHLALRNKKMEPCDHYMIPQFNPYLQNKDKFTPLMLFNMYTSITVFAPPDAELKAKVHQKRGLNMLKHRAKHCLVALLTPLSHPKKHPRSPLGKAWASRDVNHILERIIVFYAEPTTLPATLKFRQDLGI